VAVILLDVVDGDESAGLDFVEFVRRELTDETGASSCAPASRAQAPERRVIVAYAINDFKAKTAHRRQALHLADRRTEELPAAPTPLEVTRGGWRSSSTRRPMLLDFRSMQRSRRACSLIASLLNVECAGIHLPAGRGAPPRQASRWLAGSRLLPVELAGCEPTAL
jgi:hypothetical protein